MDIIMPQLGETVLEGLVTVWYKKAGDAVAADESLFEVETDKVTTAIPSPIAGVLREILIEAGVAVKVGTRLAVIDSASAAASTAPSLPQPGLAPATEAAPAAPAPLDPDPARPLKRSAHSKLSPLVRRLLGEAGVAADQVRGSGRHGRITREDVVEYLTHAPAAPDNTASGSGSAAVPAQRPAGVSQDSAASTAAGPDDWIAPLNKIRRATAAHMVRSVAASPHTLQAVEVDFRNVEHTRALRGGDWKAQKGFTLTYLPFLCAATCAALAEYPLINASFSNDTLVVHRRIHLGIAVDLAFEGLLVPVVRDANRRDLRGLALEIHSLVGRARAHTLVPDDIGGGTYTISNSGSFGTLITAPIINQPQVAILSLDGVHKKPVVIEGPEGDSIAVRPIGVIAQSFDHRAFDGAYSAAFLRRLKQAMETRNWLAELS
ncbi:MAG: dihydrolipoamide acyltransferase [Gammaproteobacteria bacterium]|nr:dihydrolipoamide acyltransferase [Gammaproteobacteria bacterium]